MKRDLIHFIYFLVYLSQLWRIQRILFQKNRITILLFHDLNPEKFDLTIKILKKYYTIIDYPTFDEIMTGRRKLEGFPLLITFDDGRIRNLDLIQSFTKADIKPLLFLSTHKSRLDGVKFITSKDINTLATGFDIGAHTHTHPQLNELTQDQISEELQRSKNILESSLNTTIKTIAYPYGIYNKDTLEVMKRKDFKYGFTVDPGYNTANTHHHLFKRFDISDNPSKYEIHIKMSGIYAFLCRS